LKISTASSAQMPATINSTSIAFATPGTYVVVAYGMFHG
jgi:hypothetical protein